MKKSAQEILKQILDKLPDEEQKKLLKKECLIVKKSKEEIRSMFMDRIIITKSIEERLEQSRKNILAKWCNCENKDKGQNCPEHDT